MEKIAGSSLSFFLHIHNSEPYKLLPAVLFDESMGGATAMLMYFQSPPDAWTSLVFLAPLFVMPENMKPSKVRLFMYGMLFGIADTWAAMPDNKMVGTAIKDLEKLKIIASNPRRYTGKPRVGPMRELARPVIGLRWVIELILNLVRMGEASEMANPSKQMGIGEVNMPPKLIVPLFSTQETPKTPSQPDGPTFVQGSGATAPPFVTSSSAASLMFNPYMWENQVAYQQCISQYGPGLQYHAPYNKEVYANPNTVKGVGLAIPEKEERILKSQGKGLGFNEQTQEKLREFDFGSDVSGSEGSSDDSGVMNRQFSKSKRQRFNQLLADGVVARSKASVQDRGANTDLALHDSVANVAETDLNLGMSLSASSAQPFLMKVRPNTLEGIDLRNERTKQSNRESAWRSRIRRQQECEKLQALAEMLKTETPMLKEEIVRLSEECGEVDEENNSLMKLLFNEIDLLMEPNELAKMYGPDAISDLIARNPNSGCSESNDNEERIPSGDYSPLHTIRIT
ncbi:hypothetical protein SO802_027807 [Lithocarpus litseifolius]|uniref:BZIP domain-containing protein n=1 Tax=Lithocarpus litseifolius TaxID=425828 RepID=A0AAW2BQ03_9ROSI